MTSQGCPCLYVTPCSDNCTCANSPLSGGCSRCCRYGSREQQQAAAQRLAVMETEREESARQNTALHHAIHDLTATLAKVEMELQEARRDLKDWQDGNLYPHTYREAVENLGAVRKERDLYRAALEALQSSARKGRTTVLEQGAKMREGK